MQYNTEEEVLKLGEMDPEFAALLSKLDQPPVDFSDYGNFEKMAVERMAGNIKALGDPPSSIKQTDVTIPTYDGGSVQGRVYQPVYPPPAGSPLIVMYHGGGFCIGNLHGEERSCRDFVEALGAVAMSLEYRLAPAHPFPAAPKTAWDGLKWAAAHAGEFGADPALGFVVGGTSAGGNLTAVLTHLARDEKLSPPLTGQYLAVPALLPPSRIPAQYQPLYLSYTQNSSAPVLPQAAIDMFIAQYRPDEHDPLYAPFFWPTGHAGLPPAYFQVNGLDPLRDDALVYERILRHEHGIKTKLDMYPGLPHTFWGFFPMLKSAVRFREDMVRGLGWLLAREPDMGNVSSVGAEGAVM